MEINNSEMVNAAEHLLYSIHMGQKKKINKQCTNNVLWKYNLKCSEGVQNNEFLLNINTFIKPMEIQKIKFINQNTNKQFFNHIIITGIYCIHRIINNGIKEYYFDYTINYVDGLAYYININFIGNNDIPIKIYSIISAKETIYNIKETEILYVEAMGRHTFWHCINITIEAMTSLKEVEARLSDNFIKIHRSYIVNKTMVREVKRCSAVMENGDEIPIPYKKFVSIKYNLKIN